jgi:autoinducer 2 (AI-2) kinase
LIAAATRRIVAGMLTDKEARQQIVQITNELFHTGHLTATGGNISARSSDGETIWITPSGLYKGALTEDSLVHIRPDGSVIQGTNKPSVEFRMHFRAYRSREGLTGAVHTHSPIATAFGICNQSFPPLNTDAIFLADTQIVPWIMPGTAELAEAVGAALDKSRGAILQNHGLMAVGTDLRAAATRAMMIEETAKLALYVKQFGGEVTLIPDDWVQRLAAYKDFM